MKTYAELQTEDRRLVVLRLLLQSAEYRANTYLLHQALPSFSHSIGMGRLVEDLAWLQERGLLEIEEVGGVGLATLTQRGADVAEGREQEAGVKRPRPGA